MDRDHYLLPGILILIVIVVLIVAYAFSGNNTFNTGTVSFEYPKAWSQSNVIGNFSNDTIYSAVTLTTNYADANSQNQPAYIILQMQQKAKGTLNLPSTNSIVMNTTNSSVSSTSISNVSATQIGSFGTNIASKYTLIDKNNFYYVVIYICPTYTLNATETAYNSLLMSLKLS